MPLREKTISGLHEHLDRTVLARHAMAGARAVDLGAGSGAMAARLRERGLAVTAVDLDPRAYGADLPFFQLDLDRPDFADDLGEARFDLVTAIEVIEHLESPICFLRGLRRLLAPGGVALITTPNVDSAPARLRHLLTGELHMMDRRVPGHITPIFYDLFTRVYLPRAGLALVDHALYPPDGFRVSRRRYAWAFGVIARLLPGDTPFGDVHIFTVRTHRTTVPEGARP